MFNQLHPGAALIPSAKSFAQPSLDVRDGSPIAKIPRKISRFLARNVRTKGVTMRNATPLVTFTFDDIPASASEFGARVLERYGARGTFYVSGGGCGAESPCGRLATIEHLRSLRTAGHEIGCHTYSHLAVSSVDPQKLADDLEQNRSFMASVDGSIVVRNFAYPYGDLSFSTKRYLEGSFESCRSLIRGVNAKVVDLGALKTLPLENATIDRAALAAVVAETVRSRGWLIFCSHDVAVNPSRFGVSLELFEHTVTAAKAAGCSLVTIAEGLKRVSGGTAGQETEFAL
jgi:peptidoglycan/xylan/chitin deacetylase (PgdA/CDA1 family)